MSRLSFQSHPLALPAPGRGTDLVGMLYREFALLTRNRINFLLSLLPTLVYLLLVNTSLSNVVGEIEYKDTVVGYELFLLPMVLMAATLGASIMASAAMFQEEMSGISTELWSYPLRRSRYLIGKIFVGITLVILQTFLALVLATVLFGISLPAVNWITLAAAAVVAAAAFNALYLVAALSIRDFKLFNVVTNISMPVLLFGSPSLYALDHMPSLLRWFSVVNPATYSITGLRDGMILGPAAAWPSLLVLAVLAVASYVVASLALLRRVATV